jgi:hypothetical protein
LVREWIRLKEVDPKVWKERNGVKGRFKVDKYGVPYWVPWVPEDERKTYLKAVHDSLLGGGHPGIGRTMVKLRRIAWWPSMSKAVKEWVKKCEACNKSKEGYHEKVAHKKLGYRAPEYTVPIDYYTDLPLTERGYKHLLVMVDKGTGVIAAFLSKTRDIKEAVLALTTGWIAIYGAMRVLASDKKRVYVVQNFEHC